MRVTFNAPYRNGLDDISASAERLADWQRQVSSGRRLQAPSDDPAAVATVIAERSEVATLDQFTDTAHSVESRLSVVDAVLSELVSSLTEAQTTAAAGRTTIATAAQRSAWAGQIRAIRDNLLSGFNTQYRGTYVFAGTASLTAPFTKDASGVVQPYAGSSQVQSLDVDRNRSVEVTLDGGAVAGDLFATLETVAAAIESGDMTRLDAGIQSLNAAFDRATTAQSRVGASLAELDQQTLRLDTLRRASDARRASLEDANLAEAISRMQQAETAYRAALSALGVNGQLSLMDYLR